MTAGSGRSAGRKHRDICEEYQKGASLEELEARHDIVRDHLVKILVRNEIELRPKDRPVCPPPSRLAKINPRVRAQEMATHKMSGYSTAAIGNAFGVSQQSVDQILARIKETGQLPTRFGPNRKKKTPEVEILREEATSLRASLERRLRLQRDIGEDPKKQAIERERCRRDVVHFINNWGWTYDPRRIAEKESAFLPFDLFPRQIEMVRFIEARIAGAEDGLIEKSRDIGFTWTASAFAVHRWIFVDGFVSIFGSYEEDKVDHKGDPSSIFEKIRLFLYRLPEWLRPKGFFTPDHDNFMRLVNPDNNNTIIGEVGDNIGRGGRAPQPLDAKILTPSGWSTMGEMHVGRVITGADGKPCRVVGVFPQGRRPVYRVVFNDGSSTECTYDHLWRVTTSAIRKSIKRAPKKPRSPRYLVLPLSGISKEIFKRRVEPDHTRETNFQIPMVAPVLYDGSNLPLDPYVLGALLGDGNLSRRTGGIEYSTADREMLDLIKERLPPGGELVPRTYDEYTYGISYGVKGHTKTNPVAVVIRKLGLLGSQSHDKFIPEVYKRGSPEQRLELLRGLFDTDGWLGRPNKALYATVSEKLAADVREIVMSLGGNATLSEREGKPGKFPGGRWYERRKGYTITANLPRGMCPFKLSRKANRYQERTKYLPSRAIVGVECVGEKEVKCIEVDAEHHLYVTDDFIVTHNTVCLLDEAAYLPHPDRVEASTSATVDCRIWASSVYGMGNLFARKRHGGTLRADQIFRFHYSSNTRMTPERVERKRKQLAATPWVWAAEYEIDYSASVEGVCIPAIWVEAAVKLHDKVPIAPTETPKAGLDIGGGKAQSVFILRRGPVVSMPVTWLNPDTTATAFRALDLSEEHGVQILNFDAPGVGQGVASTLQLNPRAGLTVTGINTGTPPSMTLWEDGKYSRQKFQNLKAELWWIMRERFRRTWEYINWLEGREEGVEHPITDLVALPPEAIELRTQLSLPRTFPNDRGKLVMETKVMLATRGVASPDQADALALTFVPGEEPIPYVVPFIVSGPPPDRWAPQW